MRRVAIGIRVEENAEYLEQSLSALRAHTLGPHELLLLLEGAPAYGAAAAFGEIPESGTADPVGAPACFNRLISTRQADVYVLLENGALVGPGWLDHLLTALTAHPRNGLAGPSTNLCWNEQAIFSRAPGTPAEVARCAFEAVRRFGSAAQTLEPLYSLAEFCYVVRREVIEDIGAADEGYGTGPCWEMDYNIRAARAGWRGVWAGAAYVHRAPSSERRRREEARLFDASKHRYQDRFCGARLRGEKTDFRAHCRGDACPNFAPLPLLVERRLIQEPAAVLPRGHQAAHRPALSVIDAPQVSCIMPTCDRLAWVAEAVRNFQRQDYRSLELIVVDDGAQPVKSLLPPDPRIRLIQLPHKLCIGAKRNIACTSARGELIMHWDDDDWYPRDRVRVQAEALAGSGALICGTSVLFYHEPASGRVWRYRFAGGRPWVAGNTLAYRKSWWTGHPFQEVQVSEDSRFVWTAPPDKVCDLRRPRLCVARIHDGNTSRKTPQGACWEPCATAELQEAIGEEWPAFSGEEVVAVQSDAPLVSCIMPTRNRRPFLPLALQTFQSQDYPYRELVIVEDGDQDVSDMVRGLDGVRYVRSPPCSSIGHKRNLACQSARGDIIAHWDDDDWYGAGRLLHQVAPLLAGLADLTGLENAFQLELENGEFRRATPELHRRMFVGNLHGGTLVYWKALFAEGLRYPEVNLAEDAAFLLQAERRGKRALRLDNPGLFVYVRHRRNSWRFSESVRSDPRAWERVPGPQGFSDQLMSAYRAASEASAPGV